MFLAKKEIAGLLLLALLPDQLFAMHIMEGFLPVQWSAFWLLLALPFIAAGLWQIRQLINVNPKIKILLAVAGAFTFALSALKIPSITGSCSHPTGIAFGTILFGPLVMAVLGSIVLLFQALLLAHGGLTTLGANTVSMAIIGSLVAFVIFKALSRLKTPLWLAIFAAAFLGDLATYVMTSLQLALAFPAQSGGFLASFYKFLGVFALTQIPLAITEGILTWLLLDLIIKSSPQEIEWAGIIKREKNR